MVSRNVGLIGLHASGKTTLLTSLIAQLKNHNPARFPIGRDGKARITEFETPPIEDADGWSSFRYQRYLSQLSERQRWPEKTTDREKFVCQFRHSDDRLGKRMIEFYDIPGERFVDMAMIDRSYKVWSADTWGHINTVTLSEAYAGFIAAVKAGGDRPDELVAAYKLGMARTLGLDRASITPSSFLLDLEGKLASDRADDGQELAPEQIVAGRHSGLPNAEFVPLPPEFLKRWSPAVVAEFTRAYEVYRKEVVRPIFDAVRRCDSLLVMVDVLSLLEYGTGMYSDTTKQMRIGLPGLRPPAGRPQVALVGRQRRPQDRLRRPQDRHGPPGRPRPAREAGQGPRRGPDRRPQGHPQRLLALQRHLLLDRPRRDPTPRTRPGSAVGSRQAPARRRPRHRAGRGRRPRRRR